MLVAIVLLGVILAAFASSIIASLTAVRSDESRVRATQLANQSLEELRALPWDELGFYATDAGYASSYAAAQGCPSSPCPTVTLGVLRPAGSDAPVPAPVQVTPPGSHPYTRTTGVYWVDDPSVAGSRDYKQFHVTLVWTVNGTSRTYEAVGTRIPTLDETPAPAPGSSAGPAASPGPGTTSSPSASPSPTACAGEVTEFAVTPQQTELTPSGGLRDSLTLRVRTCSAAVAVSVDTGRTNHTTLTAIPGTGNLQWEATVPAGSSGFDAGVRPFTATASPGSSTATRNVTIDEAPVPPPLLSVPGYAPGAPICVAKNGKSHFNIDVRVSVENMVDGGTVTLRWEDADGNPRSGVQQRTITGDAGTATFAFPDGIGEGNRFNGPVRLTLTATRTNDGTRSEVRYEIPVETHNFSRDCRTQP